MRWLPPTLTSLFILMAGCLGSAQIPDVDAPVSGLEETVHAPQETTDAGRHVVEFHSDMLYGTDGVGDDPHGQCGEDHLPGPVPVGRWPDKHHMERIHATKIMNGDTELVFVIDINNVFSDVGISGFRIGAFYDHQVIFWSQPIKESTNFTYALGEKQVDMDSDKRWTFFYKKTDPLNESDEDSCTGGHQSGSLDVDIYVR